MARPAKNSDQALIELFLDMVAAERGGAKNTLAAYARDLADFAAELGAAGRATAQTAIANATTDDLRAHLSSLSKRGSDERSDIFSVGVMAFEAVTGRRPFEGHNYAEVVTSMSRDPSQVPGAGPEVAQLNKVLARCLARDPTGRFGTVSEMKAPLVHALRACPSVATDRGRSGHVPTRSLGASKS